MKVASVAVAYNEERFIGPHLDHIPLDCKLVLLSTVPWQGNPIDLDDTARIAEDHGGEVISHHWETEEEQRNWAQEYLADYDWIVILDPDEFLTQADWQTLLDTLEHSEADAHMVQSQFTYWRFGFRIDPPEPYKQIVAVRPYIRFDHARIMVDANLHDVPVTLHHFSWSRTDEEVLKKISHYTHAHELIPNWYKDVWMQWTPAMEDLHPTNPENYKRAVACQLPTELAHGMRWMW